jgi:hypothetical protein
MAQMPTFAKALDSAWKDMSSEGGRARAARYSVEVLSEWASRGGQAVLAKYGPDYFVQLRKRRKNYPKNSESSIANCACSPLAQPGRMGRRAAWHAHATPASASGNGRDWGGIENHHGDQATAPFMTRRVQTARQNGSLGGKQGSSNLDHEQREQRARAGGNATLNLYGKDYYSFLGKLRRKTPTAPKKSALDNPLKISVATRRMWGMAAAMSALEVSESQESRRIQQTSDHRGHGRTFPRPRRHRGSQEL